MWKYNSNELYHWGIFGMKWGVRRYQNKDGSLTPTGQKRLDKKDSKWANKKGDKVLKKTKKKVQRELNEYGNTLLKDPSARKTDGKLSSSVINQYNRKMAELMNAKVGEVSAPSGRVIRFIAKRGEMGVHLALASPDYNVAKDFKNGIWGSGRVAYKKDTVDMA